MMADIGPGRKRPLSTAVGAGGDAATPSSEHSDEGDGSREGERVPAEAGHFGGGGEDWGYNPTGEQPSNVPGGLRGQMFLGKPEMAIPVLKGKYEFDIFCKQTKVFTRSFVDSRLSLTATNTWRLGSRGTTKNPGSDSLGSRKTVRGLFFVAAGFGITR